MTKKELEVLLINSNKRVQELETQLEKNKLNKGLAILLVNGC